MGASGDDSRGAHSGGRDVSATPAPGSKEFEARKREFEERAPLIAITDEYDALPEAQGFTRDHSHTTMTPPDRARSAKQPPTIHLRPIHEIVAEEREAVYLLHRILEAAVLAVIAGPRSTFKRLL